MDEFGLVWLSSVWFDEVDFIKCSRSASQLSFTNLFSLNFPWPEVRKSDCTGVVLPAGGAVRPAAWWLSVCPPRAARSTIETAYSELIN